MITLPRYKSEDGLAYCQMGDSAVPIVFIHGVGLRSECWYQQVVAFKSEYSVFTMDMPGHGESDLLDKADPNLLDYTEKLAKFIIDEVKQPAVIVGHSMGGLLALSLAKEYPELCLGVVAMNTIYKRSELAKEAVLYRASKLANYDDLSQADVCAPIPRWFSEIPSEKDKVHAQLCKEWLLSTNVDGYSAAYNVFATEDGPRTVALGELTMPVLYITGELDFNSNKSMANEMARLTPFSEAIIIDGSRHMTPLTHSFEVNNAIEEFLQTFIV